MAVTFEEFFQLLGKSRLLRPNQLEHLRSRLPGDHNQEDAKPLARRLVMDRVITRYQATVLLGGRSGPFLYGDYQVFDRIRGGRLSGMFKAVHTPTGHPVLLKFASGDVAQDARQWELADRYVRAQTQAVHAQLQRVCELADLTKYRFLVLENLSGQSLQNALENGKRPVPTDEACRLTRLVAMGLTYLHQHGHVYGDVRPRNLWLEPNGNIRFLRDHILPPTVPDIFADDLREEELDRFDYMAPELANPGTPVSPLTDIYALGCTLYELLSGTRPFPGGKPNEKLERHATEPIKPLDSAGVPAELREVVAYMMAKQATVRTSDASEIVEQLSRYVSPDDLPIPPSTPTATQIAYDVAIRQQAPTPVPPPAHVPPPPAAPAPVTTKPAPAPEPIPPGMPANETPAESASQVPVASDSPASNAIGGVQVIHTEEASQTSDRVRRVRLAQRNRTKMLAAFALTLIVASLGVLAFSPRARMALFGSSASDSDKQISQSTEPQTPEELNGPDEKPNEPVESGEPSGSYVVMPDNGQLLWASPTAGDPVSLNYVPPGAQAVFVARPAELMKSKDGARVIQALGSEFAAAREKWEANVGVTWEKIAQLVFTLHDNGQDVPRAAYVIHLLEPLSEEDLVGKWGQSKKVEVGSSYYYESGQRAFYMPKQSDGQILVVASPDDMKEVIEFAGAEPALRREMATLIQSSDHDRHVTVVFAPSFLFNNLFRDGRVYSFGEGREIRRPLEWLFEDNLKACLLSFQFDEPFYLELRAYGQVNHDTPALAAALQQRLQEAPDLIEAHFQEFYPPAYWRRVALRVPQMARFLHQQTRIGVEDNQAIVNAALPAPAAHNLAFAGQMLITAPQSNLAPVAVVPDTPTAPKTIGDLLATTMNLSFDQKSLEFAMRDLAADVKEAHPTLPFEFDVKILGTDLQLNGITRNQQIAEFSANNQSIANVLTSLVMRANPVTTVQAPSELDQKLIWVVGPDPDMPDRQIVLITTRDAAARKSYTLPKPFQPES